MCIDSSPHSEPGGWRCASADEVLERAEPREPLPTEAIWGSITKRAELNRWLRGSLRHLTETSFFSPSAPHPTLWSVDDMLFERGARASGGDLSPRVKLRLDSLAADISRDGQMVPGSQNQPVAHPLLRIEKDLRAELRRVSADLGVRCGLHLDAAPRLGLPLRDRLGVNPRRTTGALC